jgi:membrane protein YdbS with pleckstrin-like domain
MTEPSASSVSYPARLEIDYQEKHNRVTTLFRVILIIPIAIVFAVLTEGVTRTVYDEGGKVASTTSGGIATGLFLATLLMIVFRRRYPRWWFDFAVELTRFGTRIGAYLGLLTDQYPSTVEEQRVDLHIDYPDVERDLNRWLPLVKWLLAIPHYLILVVLSVAAVFTIVIAWFAILFTGPAWLVRLCGRRQPLVAARSGVRVLARHRPLSALLPHLIPASYGTCR